MYLKMDMMGLAAVVSLLSNVVACHYDPGRGGGQSVTYQLPTPLTRRFNAIYQFGDSISDTGNGLRENPTSGLCTSFPYGESYFGYVTGRCSDGLIMADYYECRNKMGKSLFLMEAMGGNDYNYAFGDDKSFQVVYDLVPYVIQAITDGVKETILLGATYIVVPTIIPFGCMPNYLASVTSTDPSLYDQLGCLKSYNKFSEFHNHQLLSATNQLQILYPNVTLIYADYYSAIMLVIRNAAALGFDEEKRLTACCGGGNNPYNYDSSEMCGDMGVPVCPNPKERIHWDGLHFTQQLYQYVSGWMLNHTILPRLTHRSSA